jgi:hypothetical protein
LIYINADCFIKAFRASGNIDILAVNAAVVLNGFVAEIQTDAQLINSRITLSPIASTARSPAWSRQNFETRMICLGKRLTVTMVPVTIRNVVIDDFEDFLILAACGSPPMKSLQTLRPRKTPIRASPLLLHTGEEAHFSQAHKRLCSLAPIRANQKAFEVRPPQLAASVIRPLPPHFLARRRIEFAARPQRLHYYKVAGAHCMPDI